jgi:hypothetical protein
MSSSSLRRLTMHGCALAASFILLVASRVGAQVTETPVTFDSSGRVPAITAALAERLRLGPPAWPVTGQFERARLYRTSDGAYVLVVERRTKSLDRYALSDAQASELRLAVQAPLRAGARAGIGEQTDVASEPAGNAFVRNQAMLGLLIYGPAAAGALTNEPAAGTATDLLVAGGTFFAAMARRQASPAITTAQNNLSTWAALDGAALGGAVAYVAGVDDGHVASGAVLLGSIGGTLAGLRFGKNMTDAEAAASSFGGNELAATSVGVMGITGALESGDRKAQVALASTALVTGFALGPLYPRRASYTVTAGDVHAVGWASALGVAAAFVPFADGSTHDTKAVSAALTAGLLGGLVVGDRLLARPYDHTRSEALLLSSGIGAGALIGGGLAAAGKADNQTTYTLGVAGAILGAAATEGFFRSSPRSLGYRAPVHGQRGTGRVGVSVNPMGLAFAAGRRPGRFSIVRVTF